MTTKNYIEHVQIILTTMITMIIVMCPLHPLAPDHTRQPKILVFISKGGYGHITAFKSIEPLLADHYEIVTINPLQDTLKAYDFNRTLFHKDCEEMYNFFLKKGWISIINFYCRFLAPRLILSRTKQMTTCFKNLFETERPDLILSLIPVINLAAGNAAAELNIPYLLVTLDKDLTMWNLGLERSTHPDLTITVHNDRVKSELMTACPNIIPENIITAGFPIRKSFLIQHDINYLKKKWQIPLGRTIITLVMGGRGSIKTKHYIKELAKNKHPYHVIVCTGLEENEAQKFKKIIARSKHVSFSCIPFTPHIAELMMIADLIISKTGSLSIEEICQIHAPVLVDKTGSVAFWEHKNITHVLENGYGDVVKKMSLLNQTIDRLIQKNSLDACRQQLRSVTYTFDQMLIPLIEQKLTRRTSLPAALEASQSTTIKLNSIA